MSRQKCESCIVFLPQEGIPRCPLVGWKPNFVPRPAAVQVPQATEATEVPTAVPYVTDGIATAIPVQEEGPRQEHDPWYRGRINANKVFVMAKEGKSLFHLIKFMEICIHDTTKEEQEAFAHELAYIIANNMGCEMQIKALVYEAYLEVNKKMLPRRYLAQPPRYSKSQ